MTSVDGTSPETIRQNRQSVTPPTVVRVPIDYGVDAPAETPAETAGPPTGGADWSTELAVLVSELAVDEAARRRSRERSLRDQAMAEASLCGILVDLAEAGADVWLMTAGGRTHRGVITRVGNGWVGLHPTAQAAGGLYVALGAIVAVQLGRSAGSVSRCARPPNPTGSRSPACDRTLGEQLAELATERPRVWVGLRYPGARSLGALGVTGRLWAVGVDVLTVHLERDRRSALTVALDYVSELAVLGAG